MLTRAWKQNGRAFFLVRTYLSTFWLNRTSDSYAKPYCSFTAAFKHYGRFVFYTCGRGRTFLWSSLFLGSIFSLIWNAHTANGWPPRTKTVSRYIIASALASNRFWRRLEPEVVIVSKPPLGLHWRFRGIRTFPKILISAEVIVLPRLSMLNFTMRRKRTVLSTMALQLKSVKSIFSSRVQSVLILLVTLVCYLY